MFIAVTLMPTSRGIQSPTHQGLLLPNNVQVDLARTGGVPLLTGCLKHPVDDARECAADALTNLLAGEPTYVKNGPNGATTTLLALVAEAIPDLVKLLNEGVTPRLSRQTACGCCEQHVGTSDTEGHREQTTLSVAHREQSCQSLLGKCPFSTRS